MKLRTTSTIPSLLLTGMIATLVGCGGSGAGQENTANPPPPPSGDQGIIYNGPTALNEDVAVFQREVWQELTQDDKCGACHNEEAGQEPMFMRRDNINDAYQAVLPLVDKTVPSASRLVTKAEEGHNNWNPTTAEIIENLISRWASATGADQAEIVLEEPPLRTVDGTTLRFPSAVDGANIYRDTVYAMVNNPATAACVGCHSEDAGANRQSPFFATNGDIENAYLAAIPLMNINNASTSRLVERMREGHNTWAPDSAQQMQNAIQAFIDAVSAAFPPQPIDPNLLASNALLFSDGQKASTGGRIETDVIALYSFSQGEGGTAFDTSAVSPELNLSLTSGVEWVGTSGIRFIDSTAKAQGDIASSTKLYSRIRASGEYSIEAWVVPANVVDEERRIISYSGAEDEANFGLHQTTYDYDFLTRSSETGVDGMPMLSTPSADEVLQATLQHVVTTFNQLEGRRIYVNGELVAEDATGGNLNDWNAGYAFVLGNEVDSSRGFSGALRLVAIHERALTQEQITANYDAGVGDRFFFLFGVSDLVNMPQAYVGFIVEQFDTYSYLFNSPFFISLDSDAVPSSPIRIAGIRIGVNGQEAPTSQGFANLDFTVDANNYNGSTGTPIAFDARGPLPVGTLVALENDPNDPALPNDEFFLTFDVIGDNTYTLRPDEPVVPWPEPAFPEEEQPEIGLRLFDEIFENMSALTTVPSARVHGFYRDNLRASLPSSESVYGFLSSQQSAVTQLALAYCNELVSDNALRSAYFPGFDFGGSLTTGNAATIIDPLVQRMLIDSGLASQPDPVAVREDLNTLVTSLSGGGSTQTKVSAVCTAALASAVVTLQ